MRTTTSTSDPELSRVDNERRNLLKYQHTPYRKTGADRLSVALLPASRLLAAIAVVFNFTVHMVYQPFMINLLIHNP